MTPTQAEAIAYGEREAKRLKDLGLLNPVEYFDAARWLAVGYQSGLIAGRKEAESVFVDTVQALS